MAEIISMPKLGFDMAEGTLVRWIAAEGDSITKGGVIAEIETDKATVEVESAFSGVLVHHIVSEGDIVPINTPIAVVADEGEDVDLDGVLVGVAAREPAEEEQIEAGADQPGEQEPGEPLGEVNGKLPAGVKVSPLARRMAKDNEIDLRQITGSGTKGRIVKADIEEYLISPRIEPSRVAPPLIPTITDVSLEDETIQLNRLRMAIGRRMTEAKQTVPHFYVTHEYDMAGVMATRKQVNSMLPEDEKTSVNDYVLKAVALTLREFPNLNATFAGEQIIHHGHVNIGVAVAVEGGLLTIVNRDTDLKSVRQISQETKAMVSRARSGKVKPDDIEGSTFSVSNLGMFGVEHFIAIINPPEAAILAVGAVREIPVIVDNQIVPGLRMKATLSVDHRVSDGVEAAQFLQSLAKYFGEPLRLLLEGYMVKL
jgi:pyruvate dehydrogenase E2 component (dihydrolipoamide acetyltransferase)